MTDSVNRGNVGLSGKAKVITLAVLLVILGVGGYWFYQSSSVSHTTSAPAGQQAS